MDERRTDAAGAPAAGRSTDQGARAGAETPAVAALAVVVLTVAAPASADRDPADR